MALISASLAQLENSILVLIDIQQRLTTAMPEDISNTVIKQTNVLLQAAETLQIPVIVTEQYPKGLGHTVPELMVHIAENSVVEKTGFSCAKSSIFMTHVLASNRKQIILTGMESHICILQTALELQALGFQVFVVEDAVCSRTKKNHKNALQRLRNAGIVVTNLESVIFEWLGDAKHPEFKTLAKLIV